MFMNSKFIIVVVCSSLISVIVYVCCGVIVVGYSCVCSGMCVIVSSGSVVSDVIRNCQFISRIVGMLWLSRILLVMKFEFMRKVVLMSSVQKLVLVCVGVEWGWFMVECVDGMCLCQ